MSHNDVTSAGWIYTATRKIVIKKYIIDAYKIINYQGNKCYYGAVVMCVTLCGCAYVESLVQILWMRIFLYLLNKQSLQPFAKRLALKSRCKNKKTDANITLIQGLPILLGSQHSQDSSESVFLTSDDFYTSLKSFLTWNL